MNVFWYFLVFLVSTLHFLSGSLISWFYISELRRYKIVNNLAFPSWLMIFFTVSFMILDIIIHPSYELISILLNYNSIMQEIIMQTLSQILVLLMQQPVLWIEQGCEPTLCTYYTSCGIISSLILKAYLKAGKGEKQGSFWNISMLRNYVATIWINTTGILCVLTAPNVQTHRNSQKVQEKSFMMQQTQIMSFHTHTSC